MLNLNKYIIFQDNMSIKISLSDISDPERLIINKDLKFEKVEQVKGFNKSSFVKKQVGPTIYAWDVSDDDHIYLPLYWAQKYVANAKRPNRDNFNTMNCKFIGELRDAQKEIKKESINLLNKKGSCILALYTGCGKTITSINIACTINLPTLILCHRLVLIDQWVASIQKVCENAKIQVLNTKSDLDETADFYIMNSLNVNKKYHGFFKRVGTLIVDECHTICSEKLSQSLYYINPRYSIALSATPYRSDGMDELLYAYFGKELIYRKMHREHYAFKIKTNFEPTVELGVNGKVNWNSVINSQCLDENRNKLIVNIVKFFRHRNFLILSKRVEQVNKLVDMLRNEGEDVTSLVGIKKFFDTRSRILIATCSKAGVGFDHPKLDSLIIASDLEEYFIQYLGRVFRTEDGIPLIFDLVDNFKILQSHFYTRRKVYIEHGGIISDFSLKNIVKVCKDIDTEEFKNVFPNYS